VRLLAVEPATCPTLTKGRFEYDFGDTAGLTPLLPMYTLGHHFVPPAIHAGGLRYHGDSPLVSSLVRDGRMEAVAYPASSTCPPTTTTTCRAGCGPSRPDRRQQPQGAVSGSGGAHVMPASVSTGKPSRIQYSIPPIISRTWWPSRASASAARVAPLQPGPQQ
jgi:hypothetical protein